MTQINEPHVAPLTAFVEVLRDEKGIGYHIPNFDPWDGGINAEVLFLLEAPGAKARDSGFISRNNPDASAKNVFELNQEAGIDRNRSVLLNVVPWYIGSECKIRPASADDVKDGMESVDKLIALLPQLSTVALMGRKAQKAERHIRSIRPDLEVHCCPHPSPLFVNNKPENRGLLLNQLKKVKASLDSCEYP